MSDKIKRIKGSNNILLIAPHGVYGNDDDSGTLAKALYERLNCYAVINEHYPRDIANLNSLDDIIYNDELISSYLMPIVEYKCELCGHVEVRITWKQLPSIICLKCGHEAYRIMPKSSSRTVAPR